MTLRDPSTITLSEATIEELVAAFQVKERDDGEGEVLFFPAGSERLFGEPVSVVTFVNKDKKIAKRCVCLGPQAVIVTPIDDEELPIPEEA